ncbi:mitochondrial processing peptidase beta subunit [Histomonas meleagridis]|uniref:mitochondrial processing peptidase beta subunit n=1 Tax=Histomonas meleagridis TaxID=135588 RepID=UPI003559BF80|nr:mitochondrial processing peptidase beta subunit [Histomonas meleagridis]KAH0801373.1 mitochondrial processing peptidase beta subunit [Histomonas meleagridis]
MSILASNAVPKITHLSNGIKVATIPVLSELSTVGIWVKSGSIYENKENNGVAHFLEHVIFHGNEKYPQEQLEKLADQKGINLKAATSRTTTSFFALTEQKQIPQAVDILSQIVFNPSITDKVVNLEKPTILEEEFEVAHDFNEVLWDRLHEVSFPDSSVGRPILGTKPTITSITPKMLVEHHSKFFNPHNCYFICASKLPHEQIVEAVHKATEFIKQCKPFNIETVDKITKVHFSPRAQLFTSKALDRSWCGIGISGPSLSAPLYPACQLVRSIIGDVDPASLQRPPLLESSSIKRLSIQYVPYNATGLLAFIGDTDFGREQQWIDTVVKGIQRATVDLTDDDLKMGKLQLVDKLSKNLTSTVAVADDLGLNLLLAKSWRSPDQWKEIVSKITKEHMQQFAMTYLNKKPFSAVMFMPTNQEEEKKQK